MHFIPYNKVSNIKDINEKIVPFLNKYPIYGEKYLDFSDFCKALDIIKVKKHLKKEGLEQLRTIKSGMNTGRF